MNGGTRELVTLGVICCSLTAGVSMLVVDPAHRALSEARADLDSAMQAERRVSELAGESERWARAVERAESARAWLDEAGAQVEDPARVHQDLRVLADDAGIELLMTEPRQSNAGRGDKTAAAIGFQIEAVGSYAGVAVFLDRLARRSALTRVDGFRLSPVVDDGQRRVRAMISTTHTAIDTAPALASVGEGVGEGEGP